VVEGSGRTLLVLQPGGRGVQLASRKSWRSQVINSWEGRWKWIREAFANPFQGQENTQHSSEGRKTKEGGSPSKMNRSRSEKGGLRQYGTSGGEGGGGYRAAPTGEKEGKLSSYLQINLNSPTVPSAGA